MAALAPGRGLKAGADVRTHNFPGSPREPLVPVLGLGLAPQRPEACCAGDTACWERRGGEEGRRKGERKKTSVSDRRCRSFSVGVFRKIWGYSQPGGSLELIYSKCRISPVYGAVLEVRPEQPVHKAAAPPLHSLGR